MTRSGRALRETFEIGYADVLGKRTEIELLLRPQSTPKTSANAPHAVGAH